MKAVKYQKFSEINPSDLLSMLNRTKVRKHLIDHPLFTVDTLNTWMDAKIAVDSIPGCRIRAIVFEGTLAGWCGIQLEYEKYELAIVIDDQFWGLGKAVFQDMMKWAKELGHKEVFIHFLHTRPGYRFLDKIAKSVHKTNMHGDNFTTYQLEVK
ncbi:GNAT family N-acetyltransferase [Microbulbifer spongiae]|uniref:GNAT family N-acetyltransferase n=1 Tax=Microbulbifer spongiae TaxID=2944933 RepID=A0ABY9EDY9_9GAMM|nr:GNAT family N-acetyltransferase [Microbulbifer sp. MI-G]WKD51248.1 GNAT family N-acetyltransferase [Microbulbifer sp. MI-G]